MTAEPSGIRYQRIRAPRGHGEALVQPSPLHAEKLVAENRSRLTMAGRCELGFEGIPLDSLRAEAREDVLRLAREHVTSYRDISGLKSLDGPIIMTGHQPALYHPGVWFKNVLADRIASQVQGVAINVIIDNDVAPAPSLSAITGTVDHPRPTRIAYDQPGPRVAWEMTHVESMERLRSFAKRVEQTMEPFVADPLVHQFWPLVVKGVEAGKPLGLAFSAARNCLEQTIGVEVLDVPLSQLCQTAWFCRVMSFVFSCSKEYRQIYNQSVQQYRKVHKIRSTSHPVPNLGEDGSWVETPFWVWTRENASRRGLWVSGSLTHLLLTDRVGWQIELAYGHDLPLRLQELTSLGIFIRPRALMTTTILRLLASDLFIHGIGGAKYDQVTDEINRQLFGFEPPEFVTATATAQLPIDSRPFHGDELHAIKNRIRDAEFNPERAFDRGMEDDPQWQSLLNQKSNLLAKVPNFPEKRLWHRQLQDVNSKLRKQIAEPVARLRIERDQIVRQRHQEQLLTSREYSLLFFPVDGLRKLLLDLAEKEI